MSIQLAAALLAPLLLSVCFEWPFWLAVLVGMIPWPVSDLLFRHSAPSHISEGFLFVSCVQISLIAYCLFGRLLLEPKKYQLFILERGPWLYAVILPPILMIAYFAFNGISIEFPSDTSVYFHRNLQLLNTTCAENATSSFAYVSSCNWYYATQRYLWGAGENLSIHKATGIACLNSFLLASVSLNMVWRSTGKYYLCWLGGLLLLLGFGNQSFHFYHQIGLNGTLAGIALILAASTPAQAIVNQEKYQPLRLLLASLGVLFCGYLAYLSHGLNAYFTLNILIAAWIGVISHRRLDFIALCCISIAVVILLALSHRPWSPTVSEALSYPTDSRFIHFFDAFWGRSYWYWPAMPNSALETSFTAAMLIGLAVLCVYYSKDMKRPASLLFCYLPFIVLAEWLAPLSSNLIFKIIHSDTAYRVGWTSLFWILIPIGLDDIKEYKVLGKCTSRVLHASLGLLMVVLSVPIGRGGNPNIFRSKVIHLGVGSNQVTPADGSNIMPLVVPLKRLCSEYPKLARHKILSDPFVGFILESYVECAKPLASRDLGSLSLQASEENQYPGFADAISSSKKTKEWLDKKDVYIIILNRQYPNYWSMIGSLSGQWQPDLISTYRHLSINRLTPHSLREAGFTLNAEAGTYAIYTKRDISKF